MGFKLNSFYTIGLTLCLTLFTGSAAAEQKQLLLNEELRAVYNLLFSKTQKTKQKSHAARPRFQTSNARKRVVWSARKQLRKKYRWGGTSPKTGFDCSGLMQYVYKSIRVDIPRTAKAQYKHTKRIPLSKLQAGDLIFFHTRRTRTRVNHVGLYLGNNKFIHAPRRGKRVSVANLNKYWLRKVVGAGRI